MQFLVNVTHFRMLCMCRLMTILSVQGAVKFIALRLTFSITFALPSHDKHIGFMYSLFQKNVFVPKISFEWNDCFVWHVLDVKLVFVRKIFDILMSVFAFSFNIWINLYYTRPNCRSLVMIKRICKCSQIQSCWAEQFHDFSVMIIKCWCVWHRFCIIIASHCHSWRRFIRWCIIHGFY